MRTEVEAPVAGPRTSGRRRELAGVARRSARSRRSTASRCASRRGDRRRRRAERVRQVDAAGARLRPAGAGRGRRVDAAPAALMPQRDALLPWLSALDNAGAGAARRRAPRKAAGARGRARALRRLRARRASSARGPRSCPAGCASASRSCARCWPGRPVLCLDEPFGALDALTRAQMQRWLAGALAREPRTVLLVTHDVEEAVVLADRVVAALAAARAASSTTLDVDLPRPARAHGPGGRRAARPRAERAGGDA